jgi:hypothetical protein
LPYKFWWLLGPWEWQTVTSCLIYYDDYLAHENHRFLLVSMEIKGINKMLHVVMSMFIYFLSCFRFKLHFIAYVGYTSEGDIALDDISLSPACFGKLNSFHHVLHFKWEFHKFVHACILPYRGSQIIVTVCLGYFWSCCLFFLAIFIKMFVHVAPQ